MWQGTYHYFYTSIQTPMKKAFKRIIASVMLIAMVAQPSNIALFGANPSIGTSSTVEASNNIETPQEAVISTWSDMTVVKTVDVVNTYVWSQLVYTIAYENLSAFTATNVSINDTIPDGTTYVSSSQATQYIFNNALSWALWDLPWFATGVITVIIDTDNMQPSAFKNYATVYSDNDTDDTNNVWVSQYTTISTDSDMTVIKTVDITNATVGTQLTYTITYENLSAFTATNVSINDTIPDGTTYVSSSQATQYIFNNALSWALWDLPWFATGVITVIVDTDNMQPSTFKNYATVYSDNDYDDTNNVWVSQDTTLSGAASTGSDMSVIKTVDITSTYIGTQLTYTITYENLSAFTATNVSINDTIPDGTTYVSSSQATQYIFNNALSWALWDLPWFATGVITVIVDTDNMQPSTFKNYATVYSDNDTNDTNNVWVSQDTTILTTPVESYVDLRITKVANTEYAHIGSQIQYTIEYFNDGNTTAYNVSVTDTLPVGTTLISASTTPTTNNSGVLTWEIGWVAAGASWSITITVDTDNVSEGTITNVATVDTACKVNEVLSAFEESVPTTEEPAPITEEPAPITEEPAPITEEPAPITEEPAPITEEPAPITEEPAPITEEPTPITEEIIIQEEIPLPPMLLDVGPQSNIEESNQEILCDANTENNSSKASTELYIAPTIDMSITKIANTSSVTVWGQITYTITYINNGNTVAEWVTVTDTLPEWLTFVSSNPVASTWNSGIQWNIGTVNGWGSGTITVVVTANTVWTFSNAASVSSRCYKNNEEFFIQELDEEIINRPIKLIWIACDNNEENNNTTSAPVTVNQQPQSNGGGGQSFGWGFTPPVTQLLDTGVPQLLDTWAPQSEEASKKLTRWEAAKMLSEYYRNVLKQNITRTEVCNPSQYKDYSRMWRAMRNYIWDACSLGLMWWKNDRKTLLESFRPNDYMTKGEFAAVISRMLYNTDWRDLSWFRYRGHIYLLKHYKIIQGTIRANDFETKGNAEALLKLKK
jgi:large repetitive protein